MLTSVALVMLLAAPVKVAATGFTATGEDARRASVWLERFAEVMRRDKRVEVVTADDLAQLVGIERQKALLGCDEAATLCITELANALGTDGVLVGSITRSEDSYLAVVKILRQRDAKVWWSVSGRMKGEGALLDWLDEQASAAVDAIAPRAPVRAGPFILGGAGLVSLGIGAAFLAVANTSTLTEVRMADSEPKLAAALDAGRTQSTVGVVLLSVGGAALVSSIIWLALPPSEAKPNVAFIPTQNGGFAVVGGRW
jgi:hypothetical protein